MRAAGRPPARRRLLMDGIVGRILITGGTGSLGRAILRRSVEDGWDASFVVFSRDEAKQAAMRECYPDVAYVLGDVRDYESLTAAMRGVDVVIHAAAYKRVPEAERQPITAADANVNGSANVVNAVRHLGTPRAIAISTDKASETINAYGATKLLMERMFQAEALERPKGPRFTLTRYGNVLSSTGSVIPAFRAQAAAGGPLRITDPHMTRFWLTLDDAVDLVVAGLDVPNGCILIPRCLASSMAVLAEAVAPGVRSVLAGNRGGEKGDERLLNGHEAPYAFETPDGFVLSPMVGAPAGFLAEGFEYRSDTAPQFTAKTLRGVIEALDGPVPVRTLA